MPIVDGATSLDAAGSEMDPDTPVTSSEGSGVSFDSLIASFGVGSNISARLKRFSLSKLASTTLTPQMFWKDQHMNH